MRLLLDTCTFLWITSGSEELSDTCRTLFRAPENEVFLSAASAWEITIKYELGKLPLPEPPREFVPRSGSRTASTRCPSLSLPWVIWPRSLNIIGIRSIESSCAKPSQKASSF